MVTTSLHLTELYFIMRMPLDYNAVTKSSQFFASICSYMIFTNYSCNKLGTLNSLGTFRENSQRPFNIHLCTWPVEDTLKSTFVHLLDGINERYQCAFDPVLFF